MEAMGQQQHGSVTTTFSCANSVRDLGIYMWVWRFYKVARFGRSHVLWTTLRQTDPHSTPYPVRYVGVFHGRRCCYWSCHWFVSSRLDYTAWRHPACVTRHQQAAVGVLNASAQLLLWKYDHVVPLLQELHWLWRWSSGSSTSSLCLSTVALPLRSGAAARHRRLPHHSRQRLWLRTEWTLQ